MNVWTMTKARDVVEVVGAAEDVDDAVLHRVHSP